jgi:hypothetical protein
MEGLFFYGLRRERSTELMPKSQSNDFNPLDMKAKQQKSSVGTGH